MCFLDVVVYNKVCVYNGIVIYNNALIYGHIEVCRNLHVCERGESYNHSSMSRDICVYTNVVVLG
ncbi:hypothetical protein MCY_01557 [Bartonella rattimassiliensis 15908]|uniref:Uncharacterized protein n=1 Tax=Bartonella rattimassiliensis 15908 TaxID=1094556 RepID=J0QCH6_9HYPH|nr:hypothetical protein MCY_01557 [Bartonella rattimassiliensis 15908]